MRRVLVLGGTAWLGREVARVAAADGAEVVCLARGISGPVALGAQLVTADRTRPDAYDSLEGEWDDVVELAYAPALVTSALDALADRARHWTLVSSVSVYRRNDVPGADESAELVDPVDLAEYADAKVAAERATAARLGDRLLIARPGLVVGPGDPSDRFGYWPARLARGGSVLAPRTRGRFVQVIDVRDLATWLVRAGRAGVTGPINAVGPSLPFADTLATAAAVSGSSGSFIHADDAWLLDHDVAFWAGPRSLPLWLPEDAAGFAQRTGTAFRAAGGHVRPLEDTVAAVLADERARGLTRSRRSGLAPTDEADLLATLRRAP